MFFVFFFCLKTERKTDPPRVEFRVRFICVCSFFHYGRLRDLNFIRIFIKCCEVSTGTEVQRIRLNTVIE